jgi:hypothetical protein
LQHAEVLAFQGKSYRLRNPPPAVPPTDTADDRSNTAIPPADSKLKEGDSTPPSDKPHAWQE